MMNESTLRESMPTFPSDILSRIKERARDRIREMLTDDEFQAFCRSVTGRSLKFGDEILPDAVQAWDQHRRDCIGCDGRKWRYCGIWERKLIWNGQKQKFEERACELALKSRLEERIREAEIPKRFRLKTFSEFHLTPGTSKAYQACREYANGELDQGLLLWGPVGTGKTHLVTAALVARLKQGESGFWCHAPTLLWRIQQSWNPENPESEYSLFRKATGVRHLVLDELGKDKPSEWVRLSLLRLIDARYNDELPILATTNFSPDELAERIGDWNMSRLVEMCRIIEVKGEDWRARRKSLGSIGNSQEDSRESLA